MKQLLDNLLDLLFPPKCPFCGAVVEHPGICEVCEKELPRTQETDAVRTGPGALRCCAPLWYEGAVRDGILRLKFGGSRAAARPLGELLAQCAAERFSGEFDLVTWVPVGRRRLRERGYDQGRLLAQSACRLWDVKPVALLRKISDNPPQSTLTEASARRANVLGVYEAINPRQIAGSRILLLDDVCTTGATLGECVRVLEQAGAARVVCAAVAITREKQGTVRGSDEKFLPQRQVAGKE